MQHVITHNDVKLMCQVDGIQDATAPTIVLAHALGTSLRIWDDIVPLLPDELRVIRFDQRGHGTSSAPTSPYTMGGLISDAGRVCDALKVKDAIFVGMSVGGMIAQGLATKRPDLIRGLVLANTAAKIGNAKLWQERIDAVRQSGLEKHASTILPRWFGRDFLKEGDVDVWRDVLISTPTEGYTGTCAAIAGTDFYTPTAALRIPTLGIAGSEDKSTPPDLVRETIDLIPGSQFVLMRRAGHLPCIEQPVDFARHLNKFLQATGHLAP